MKFFRGIFWRAFIVVLLVPSIASANQANIVQGGINVTTVTRKVASPASVMPIAVTGVESKPPVIVSAFQVGDTGLDYVEIYNQSSTPVDLSQLYIGLNETKVPAVSSKMWLLPGDFTLISRLHTVVDAALPFLGNTNDRITHLSLIFNETTVQAVGAIPDEVTTVKHNERNYSTIGKTYNFSQNGNYADYYMMTAPTKTNPFILSPTLPIVENITDDGGLVITEFLAASKTCSPDTMNLASCNDYIKIKNTSGVAVNLAKYRIATSSTGANGMLTWHQPSIFGTELMLESGATFVITKNNSLEPLNLTSSSSGYITLQDIYGTATFSSVNYDEMTAVGWQGVAAGYDITTGVWKKVHAGLGAETLFIEEEIKQEPEKPAPKPCRDDQYRSEETGKCRNIAAEKDTRVPCRDDQYRSEETGRCRKVATAPELIPCATGQYRSEETGRCRKIAASSSLKPCKAGQYRSEETNRCRSVAADAKSQLKACKEGQYRSEETNRCRSIASAANAAKPCKEDQFRNPNTGRCKKIASAEDILKPCKVGYERNAETNRCRKVQNAEMPSAGYAVEEMAKNASTVAGWWAFGGVLTSLGSIGAWEWRRELLNMLQKIGGFFTSGNK